MENTTPISRIMTRKPVTVGPNETLQTVRHLFEDKGFHHLPVVEGADKLVGIISYTDYLRVISNVYNNPSEQQRNEMLLNAILVHEIMSKELIYLAPIDTIEDAIRAFRSNQIHALPVVEGNGHLVGILSTHDLIKTLEKVLAPEIDYAVGSGIF